MNTDDPKFSAKTLSRRRSRIVLTLFLLVTIALSIAAALLIQRGLADEELQRDLQELREQRR